mmetsp:Transcript_81576/g.147323  ORF Transcript_81576/g.147323 Transcript_81576/m.147323 type:complete len:252 (+) Transcript_81576:713-1468(+)
MWFRSASSRCLRTPCPSSSRRSRAVQTRWPPTSTAAGSSNASSSTAPPGASRRCWTRSCEGSTSLPRTHTVTTSSGTSLSMERKSTRGKSSRSARAMFRISAETSTPAMWWRSALRLRRLGSTRPSSRASDRRSSSRCSETKQTPIHRLYSSSMTGTANTSFRAWWITAVGKRRSRGSTAASLHFRRRKPPRTELICSSSWRNRCNISSSSSGSFCSTSCSSCSSSFSSSSSECSVRSAAQRFRGRGGTLF